MEAVNHLVGLIAHNLNNEMALLSLHLIEQPEKVHETERCFGALRRSAECAAVMARLLSLAKGSDSERVAISVSALLQQVADILRPALPESIEIKTLITEKLWHVTGNPTHLRQAIINVSMNARDAMPSGGVLTLDAANIAGTENRIVIQVSDTGAGITAEMKDRLFKPFLTTKERATGLGLFTTERIVKDHGGSIEITSSVGHGSQFRIYLPAESGIGDPDNRVAYVKSA
jgi:signal transduction histidine kinase